MLPARRGWGRLPSRYTGAGWGVLKRTRHRSRWITANWTSSRIPPPGKMTKARCIRPYSSLAPSFRCGSHRKKWNASSTKRRHSDSFTGVHPACRIKLGELRGCDSRANACPAAGITPIDSGPNRTKWSRLRKQQKRLSDGGLIGAEPIHQNEHGEREAHEGERDRRRGPHGRERGQTEV